MASTSSWRISPVEALPAALMVLAGVCRVWLRLEEALWRCLPDVPARAVVAGVLLVFSTIGFLFVSMAIAA